ncbi:uncharacterized protein LOC6733009 [Drosophila simulans]|uniref:GD24288 n=1 Tax=Drosophila simulans TaxID=7240 RepID=B4Q3V7_DROSI|nr:uncharacterized protein LOC6733009 [Drosophila simulans]XP_044778498.1 uncharacterized protein LOC6733009 [Drosophila simulans]EDX05673.1 GD24288 [Drosophila simulans]KMY91232.1 uncharacterized protein Dsimw501_GD24288 [Drosophila simulans]
MWKGHKEKPTSTRSMAREVVHPERPLPPWSRLLEHNAEGCLRKRSGEKEEHYEVEISNHLWSLWGSTQQVKPGENSSSSEAASGSTSPPGQALACCVLACCAGSYQSLDSWNSSALDKIMSNGRCYYDESLATRQHWNRTGQLCLECLNTTCFLDGHEFWVDIEKLCTGKLYSRTKSLGSALSKFFGQHLQTGILQLRDQALAFGFIPEFASGGAFFLFHCQARGRPLFKDCESAPYVLRMRKLQQLLYCMLITLDERRHNVPFRIYKVGCVPRAN